MGWFLIIVVVSFLLAIVFCLGFSCGWKLSEESNEYLERLLKRDENKGL